MLPFLCRSMLRSLIVEACFAMSSYIYIFSHLIHWKHASFLMSEHAPLSHSRSMLRYVIHIFSHLIHWKHASFSTSEHAPLSHRWSMLLFLCVACYTASFFASSRCLSRAPRRDEETSPGKKKGSFFKKRGLFFKKGGLFLKKGGLFFKKGGLF